MKKKNKTKPKLKKITTGADFGTIVCQCHALPLRNLHEARLGPLVQSKEGEGSGGRLSVCTRSSKPSTRNDLLCLSLVEVKVSAVT